MTLEYAADMAQAKVEALRELRARVRYARALSANTAVPTQELVSGLPLMLPYAAWVWPDIRAAQAEIEALPQATLWNYPSVNPLTARDI